MATHPVVATHQYNTGSSRSVFPYDVYIPCYDEPEYLVEDLRDRSARLLNAKEVHCVFQGGTIKEIHAFIGQHATTEMVMVLDADLSLGDGPFSMFPTEVLGDENQFVHLWDVRNPINGLVYGHGGPKLFNRSQLRTANMLSGVDMTTAFDNGMVLHGECVGIHAFNWSAFSTWRTAVREAAKLTLLSGKDEEAAERLEAWLTKSDDNAEYADFCIDGANWGHGQAFPKNSINWINDYDHLYKVFKQLYPNDY